MSKNLSINTEIDIEETMIRLRLKQDPNYRVKMLCAFRPGASLRQINNSIPCPNMKRIFKNVSNSE